MVLRACPEGSTCSNTEPAFTWAYEADQRQLLREILTIVARQGARNIWHEGEGAGEAYR